MTGWEQGSSERPLFPLCCGSRSQPTRGKSGEEFHGWRKVPGREEEGLVNVINVDDKLESLRETPAQLKPLRPHTVLNVATSRRGLLPAQQAPSTYSSISIFMSIF